MTAISESDCVLAVGTRLNPFGTLPQYGFNYFPENATLIQVDRDHRRLGLTKRADIEVCGDARLFLQELLARSKADAPACLSNKDERMAAIKGHMRNLKTQKKQRWISI
jgi:sulfoacetaldehyde acetyltransferase